MFYRFLDSSSVTMGIQFVPGMAPVSNASHRCRAWQSHGLDVAGWGRNRKGRKGWMGMSCSSFTGISGTDCNLNL